MIKKSEVVGYFVICGREQKLRVLCVWEQNHKGGKCEKERYMRHIYLFLRYIYF